MRSLNSKRRLTWRTMPVLIAGLLAGAVLMQPAVAHVKKSLSHLTKHLDPRYYNVGEKVGDADTLDGIDSSGFARAGAAPSAHNHDDRYFTETESDARYEPFDSAYTKSESDARYEPFDSAFTKSESDARYYNVGEKVGDADTLDGSDSTGFASIARSGFGFCDPVDGTFVVCASTGAISLPRGGRVLLISTSSWDNNGGAAPDAGNCRMRIDGTTQVGPVTDIGEGTTTHNIGYGGSVAISGVSAALTAGSHTFTFECNETDADIFFTDSTISMLLAAA